MCGDARFELARLVSKRGMAAFETLGVLSDVRGTLINAELLGFENLDCLHSPSNAHHLRELVFLQQYCEQRIWNSRA